MNQNTLNGFVLVDMGLVKTTANFVAKNETAYMIFDTEMRKCPVRVVDYRNAAYRVKDWADQLFHDIQLLKAEIIWSCDGNNAPSLMPVDRYIGEKREKRLTYDIDSRWITGKSNKKVPYNLIFYNGKGEELRKKIENYRDFLVSLTYDPMYQKFIMDALNTDSDQDIMGTTIAWESAQFASLPTIAVIANLSKLQNDVRIVESEVIQSLLMQIGASDTRVNVLEAVVQVKSRYVTKGDEFEARILLAAYDSLQKPQVVIGPYQRTNNGGYEIIGEGKVLPYDARGRIMYKTTTTAVGTFALQGLMQVATPYGFFNLPFYSEYQVGESKVP